MQTADPLTIFLVDDDSFCLLLHEQYLRNLNYSDIYCFTNGDSCLGNLIQQPDVIFIDYDMGALNGLEVLKKIKRFNPNIFVVFISSQEDMQVAVNAIKFGAFDYIVKANNDENRLARVLEKIKEVKALQDKQ